MNNQPTIHQKINYRMASLLAHYTITKHPMLRNIVPKNLRGSARYNTCYDLPRPTIPTEEVNKYINESSDKVKTYLKNNLARNKYLRVDLIGTPMGLRVTHSLIKERPVDYSDMERTGAVKFVDTKDVEIRNA